MWVPTTLRRRFLHLLGEIDVAVERPVVDERAPRICKIFIEGGEARLSESFRPQTAPGPSLWTHVRSLGKASAVAIEFDCEWVRAEEGEDWRFRPITTESEPWLFFVRPDGSLRTRHGWAGRERTLASSGVTKVATVRGWKNYITPTTDQGLIVVYIRDGVVKYRNYCQTGNGMDWMSEKTLPEVPDNPVNIGACRSNDYRTLFLIQTDSNDIYLLGTKRNWAGMGIPTETISASITNYELTLIPLMHIVIGDGPYPTDIEKHQGPRYDGDPADPFHREIIAASITDYAMLALWAGDTTPVMIENIDDGTGDWGKKVKVTFDRGITEAEGHHGSFKLVDSDLNEYPAQAAELGTDPWADPIPLGRFDGTREIILTCVDFNPAADYGETTAELDLVYEAPGPLGEAEQDVEPSFTESFTAINLTPPDVPEPEVEDIWNE